MKKNDASAPSEAEKGVAVANVDDAPPSIDLDSNPEEETAPAAPAATAASARSTDPDRPTFHVMPRCSWINDPNGLCFYRGRFHAFYQHLEKEGSSDWDWAMAWGHASTTDLAFWRRELVALRPTTEAASAAERAQGEEEAEEREGKAGAATRERAEAAVAAAAEAAARAAATTASAEAKVETAGAAAAAASPAAFVSAAAAAAVASASALGGGSDAAGCWSGCLVAPSPRHAREGMRPTLLYTGVVLRKDHREGEEKEQREKAATTSSSPSRPHHHHHHHLRPHAPPPPLPLPADLCLEMVERQLVAVLSDERDERLTRFEKKGVFISHAPFELPSSSAAAFEPSKSSSSSPPASSPSSPSCTSSTYYRYDSGFRDPFVYQRHDVEKGIPWRVLIGSGKRRVTKKGKEKRSEGAAVAAAGGGRNQQQRQQ